MGCRSCEKPKVNYRRGLWSPDEDERLRDYILQHGHSCWSVVPEKTGLQRNGKSCRLRWINYLRPGLKRGIFSEAEEETVMRLHARLGNKWSQIAMHLPGRTDNEIKNYWNSYLKKRVEASNPSSSKNHAKKFPEVTNAQILYSETSYPIDTSSVDSHQTVQQTINYDSTRGTQLGPLPKILFADWLLNEDANEQCIENSDAARSFQIQSTPKTEDMYIPGSSSVDGVSTDTLLYGYGDASIYGEFQSQFEPPSQLPGGGFFDLLSMGEICGNFDVNHDVVY